MLSFQFNIQHVCNAVDRSAGSKTVSSSLFSQWKVAGSGDGVAQLGRSVSRNVSRLKIE